MAAPAPEAAAPVAAPAPEAAAPVAASAAEAAPVDSANSYRVGSGDSLWRIAGKKKVYGNSWQWPLLFINNRDLVKDPDIIKPGWDLKIKRDMAKEEVDSAVKKASDTPRYEPHTTAREHLPIEY